MDPGRPPSRTARSLFRRPLLHPPHDEGRGSPSPVPSNRWRSPARYQPSGACLARSRRGSSRVQDVLPQPCARPAAEPAADRGPLAEFFGRVAPWRTGSCDPENTIQNKTMIRKFPPVRGPEGTSEALEEGPPIAGYQAARQVHLPRRDALEPKGACQRNPLCQHDLGLKVRRQSVYKSRGTSTVTAPTRPSTGSPRASIINGRKRTRS